MCDEPRIQRRAEAVYSQQSVRAQARRQPQADTVNEFGGTRRMSPPTIYHARSCLPSTMDRCAWRMSARGALSRRLRVVRENQCAVNAMPVSRQPPRETAAQVCGPRDAIRSFYGMPPRCRSKTVRGFQVGEERSVPPPLTRQERQNSSSPCPSPARSRFRQ